MTAMEEAVAAPCDRRRMRATDSPSGKDGRPVSVARLLVFDLDDTLFPEHAFVLSGFHAVGEVLFARYGITGFYETAVDYFQAGVRGRVFDLTLEHLGHRLDEIGIETLVAVYRNHLPKITLFDDAAWALRHYRSLVRVGLLTDGYLATQQRKTFALGIQGMFDAIVYSDEYGRESWKPSPVPYLKMMELSGYEGHACVYVSDNPSKDFVAPNALGWRTVRIRREGGEYSSVAVAGDYAAQSEISSLWDLELLLDWAPLDGSSNHRDSRPGGGR